MSNLSAAMEFSPKTRSSKIVLTASHHPDKPELKLINPPSGPAKGDANSNNVVIVEDSGSTGDWDRDSIVGVSKDDTNQDDDKSSSKSDSWESIADSGPESVTGDDCLTCSDTKDAAVKSAHKKICKKGVGLL